MSMLGFVGVLMTLRGKELVQITKEIQFLDYFGGHI